MLKEWPAPMEEGNYTYILCCADESLYCGWSSRLAERVRTHNEGKGAKYTRSRLPVRLVYYENFPDKNTALKREAEIKRLSHAEKVALIEAADKIV